MKKSIVLLLVVAVVMLAGCSSTKETVEAAVETPVETKADNWWDNPPADTADVHYDVGMAKGATAQISREWAKANANTALAQYINNAIDAIVTTYINDAGEVGQSSENMQAMQAFESLSKQRAQATLTGVTYKYQTAPDGTVYVLAALPIGPLAEELKANVLEAYVRNSAAEEANRMMNEAIEKYFK